MLQMQFCICYNRFKVLLYSEGIQCTQIPHYLSSIIRISFLFFFLLSFFILAISRVKYTRIVLSFFVLTSVIVSTLVSSLHSSIKSYIDSFGDVQHMIHSLQYKYPDTSLIYYQYLIIIPFCKVLKPRFNQCCLEQFRIFFFFLESRSSNGYNLCSLCMQHLNEKVITRHIPVQVFVVEVFFGLHTDGPDFWQSQEKLPKFVCLLWVITHCVVQQSSIHLFLNTFHKLEVLKIFDI